MKLVAYLDGDIASFVAAAYVMDLGYNVQTAAYILHGRLLGLAGMENAEEQARHLGLQIENVPLALRAQEPPGRDTHMPHKNLVIASIIAHHVWGHCDGIIFGWHAQGSPYADTTKAFQRALSRVLSVGDDALWTVHAPLLMHNIKEVVHIGRDVLKLPLASMSWSCPRSADIHCGVCPGCLSRQEGFDIDDSTEYQNRGGQK